MALTIAHYEGRAAFGWDDIVEAMTTVESGTAVNVEYIPEETRAVAIHEAGHAVAGHVYMKGVESTRLSIRKRGQSLGHHQALEKEERFSSWRHEEMGRLIWTLGRDGGRARVLRGELHWRRRRRPARDRAGGLDGRLLRDGARARRRERQCESDEEREEAARRS